MGFAVAAVLALGVAASVEATTTTMRSGEDSASSLRFRGAQYSTSALEPDAMDKIEMLGNDDNDKSSSSDSIARVSSSATAAVAAASTGSAGSEGEASSKVSAGEAATQNGTEYVSEQASGELVAKPTWFSGEGVVEGQEGKASSLKRSSTIEQAKPYTGTRHGAQATDKYFNETFRGYRSDHGWSQGKEAGEKGMRTCVMNDKIEPSPEPLLDFCVEYRENSCCNLEEDAEIAKRFDVAWKALNGNCPGCIENQRKLLCTAWCSPTQEDFLTVDSVDKESDRMVQGHLRLCPKFCAAWWDSCTETTLWKEYHNHANSFCEAMIDFNNGLRVELNDWHCLDIADSPNSCDGTIQPAKPEASSPPAGWKAKGDEVVSTLPRTGPGRTDGGRNRDGRRAPNK
jgi:hypothetical protein